VSSSDDSSSSDGSFGGKGFFNLDKKSTNFRMTVKEQKKTDRFNSKLRDFMSNMEEEKKAEKEYNNKLMKQTI
jgi:hypothetical protein